MKKRYRITLFITLLAVAILCYIGYQYYRPIAPLPFVSNDNIKITTTIDRIVVEKSKHLMTVYHNNVALKQYAVALGFAPTGHKEQQGDGKTPEGSYTIIYKNPNSMFHLSLKVSYPSIQDQKNAAALGVSPGGEIMIHGLAKDFAWLGKLHARRDWTLGCIAVANGEIEEIYPHVKVGTPIIILP